MRFGEFAQNHTQNLICVLDSGKYIVAMVNKSLVNQGLILYYEMCPFYNHQFTCASVNITLGGTVHLQVPKTAP